MYRLSATPETREKPASATIGRSSDNQIVIRSDKASRRHARVTWDDACGWQIEDLGSRNGTEINQSTLRQDDSGGGICSLNNGDIVQIAGHAIVFSWSMEGPSVDASGESNGDPSGRTQWGDGGLSSQATDDQLTMQSGEAPDDHQVTHRRRRSPILKTDSLESTKTGPTDRSLLQLAFALGNGDSVTDRAEAVVEAITNQLTQSSLGVYVSAKPADPNATAETSDVSQRLPLIATRQSNAKSYRRPPDALIRQAFRPDAEALLARNILGDSNLASENSRGQIDVESLILAPIRDTSDRVWGAIHVTTSVDEAPLNDDQLDYVVTAGEILGESLSSFAVTQQLGRKLSRAKQQLASLQEQIGSDVQIIAASPAMQSAGEKISLASPTNATVLVRGESGVGKELIAAAIHYASPRRDGPFVCLNCAALSPSLLESELFGHEKGAFTGATERKQGKFESAHSGTLMLDEIGEMDADLQAKFLRVLEGHAFERVGGNRAISADVRVVAATNRDLKQMVADGTFRQDLYYRLHVIEIYVPPLRERGDDACLLAEHFLAKFNKEMGRRIEGFSEAAFDKLRQYTWPGNVRELKNVIERSVVLSNRSILDAGDLSIDGATSNSITGSDPSSETDTQRSSPTTSLADLERSHIERVLQHTGNNKSKASKILGIERSTLDRKLKRWEKERDAN